MVRRLTSVLATALAIGAWLSPAIAQVSLTPPVPSKSLAASQGNGRVVRSFSARGIETVVLRAEAAEQAQVKTIPGSQVVTVSGVPEGGAEGYHPLDPNWRETPAERWGLDFEAKRYGSTLVISSKKEILYIHHYYHLASIVIEVPQGVDIIRENRQLTGEPASDLSPPDHGRG